MSSHSAEAALDPTAYFARISYDGPTVPTEELLHGLVAAHGRTLPFENLDPLLGVPVDDLGPAVLFEKLVGRRRGGYCYEQNGLVGYVLEALGYGVDRIAGRVVDARAGRAAARHDASGAGRHGPR